MPIYTILITEFMTHPLVRMAAVNEKWMLRISHLRVPMQSRLPGMSILSIRLRYTFNLKENTSSNIPILFLFVKSFVWMWVGHKRFQQQLQLIQSSSHNKAEEQMYSFSTGCERERGLVWIVKSNILNQSWRYSWDQ